MLGTSKTLKQGRYQIISAFSQDASGGLYEALDTVSNTSVMLRESVGKFGKIATPSQIQAFNSAFAGQADILSHIKHESLVSVQDHFSEIDRQYLVLETVTGNSLLKYLEPGADRPSLDDVLSWTDQLLDALEYLHKLSPPFIHADIKPENLKRTAEGKIKLFTTFVPTTTNSNRASAEATDDPAFCYKPLEQLWPELEEVSQRVILNGYDEPSAGVLLRPLDARSDLYSAAASLYHVLTGVAPADALERTIAILDGRPDPLKKAAELNRDVPVEVSDTFMRALDLRRENRFDSAVIMRQVLRTALVRAKERATSVGNTPSAATTTANPLDIERTKAAEREREIRAEQERLDAEQNKIAARKMELEAERERHAAELERLSAEAEKEQQRIESERQEREAEAERQRVAARLAELEAKKEQERAEEERLEREAEAERRRAEEKLKELKLKQEQHRAEQKRIELEARKEIEQAEERIKELSVHDLKMDPIFVNEEYDVPQFQEQPGFNWRMPAILGGMVIALAAGVGGWMYLSGNGTPPAPQSQQAIAPTIEKPDQQLSDTTPATTDTAEQKQAIATEEKAGTDENLSGSANPKRLQSAAVLERPKKPVVDKPAAPAKKKVTVDDLINDN